MLLPLNWHFFWSFSPHGYFCQYRPHETTLGNFYLRGWWLGKWMLTEKNKNFFSWEKYYVLYIEIQTFSREERNIVRGYLQKKNKHLKNPHHHPHNFVHGSSLPFKKADCLLFTLSCNYIMIYVRSTSSFSQKFTLVFKEFGNFCCILPSYEASIDVSELLP